MMLARVRQLVRCRLRQIQWSRCYPILLPHAQADPIDPRLQRCDGTRTVLQLAREDGLGIRQIVQWHDGGLVVVWPRLLRGRRRLPEGRPRIVVVSPHPDDAVFSVGGLMLRHAATHTVTVLDVFTQTAWWRLGQSDPQQITALRQAEENLMSQLAGVDLRLLGLPEALLREHTLSQAFTAQPNDADLRLSTQISQVVQQLRAESPEAQWWLPLGIGGHLDHRLARDAAQTALIGADVRFYEDQPYAAEGCRLLDADARLLPRLTSSNLDIDESLRWKLELCRVYASQITWPRIEQLGEYAHRLGGGRAVERLWRLDDQTNKSSSTVFQPWA